VVLLRSEERRRLGVLLQNRLGVVHQIRAVRQSLGDRPERLVHQGLQSLCVLDALDVGLPPGTGPERPVCAAGIRRGRLRASGQRSVCRAGCLRPVAKGEPRLQRPPAEPCIQDAVRSAASPHASGQELQVQEAALQFSSLLRLEQRQQERWAPPVLP
jgi:hypothetical protein